MHNKQLGTGPCALRASAHRSASTSSGIPDDRPCVGRPTSTPRGFDEHLSQMIAAGCFDGCTGIVIGDHVNVTTRFETSLGLEQVFADLLVPLGIPCCFYLPIGHGPDQATLPIGAAVHFDADTGTLEVLEPAVD